MRVTAFARYGSRAASTRQRILQYIPHLHAAGIEVECHALLDDDYVASLASGDRYPLRRILRAYASRLRQVTASRRSDLLWIYSDLFPYLPPGFERLVTGSGPPIAYDLDDAFFLAYDDSSNPLIRAAVGGKFRKLFARAAACCCGNAYLVEYAQRDCANSIVIPTVVDTDRYRPAPDAEGGESVTIGWIGSPSTWCNVRPLLPLLGELCAHGGVRVKAVGAGSIAEPDRFDGLELVSWAPEREIADLQSMDIGIMPLLDRPFQRGKSGYKLIQYMSCGLPVVASPVGVNSEIVREAENGYFATTEQEWRDALTKLASDGELRRSFGSSGRDRAVSAYSLESQAPKLVDLFKSIAVAAEPGGSRGGASSA
jgi:glycosyltransferase involved in cell wall biosynthesis